MARYMVETVIMLDEFFDPRDFDKVTQRRHAKGELLALDVAVKVVNLDTGGIGRDSLCGVQTEAHAVTLALNGDVRAVHDDYVREVLDECISNAKDEAGVVELG